MSSTWGNSWGTAWGTSWERAAAPAPALVSTFLNVPTERRSFLGRTHISQSRGTDDFHGLSRRGGGLTGFLRKSRVSHPLVPVTHRTHTSADTDGGGDALDWVPANAKIYIDFVNDRAWTDVDGIVAITTLVGGNSDYSSFDAAFIVPGTGYTNGDADTTLAFVGEALAALNKIVVVELNAGTFNQFSADLYGPGFNPDLTLGLSSIGGGFFGNQSFAGIDPNSGTHKFALLSDQAASAAISIDGAANLTDSGNVSDGSSNFGMEWHGATLKTIAFYDGTTADLSALSTPA